MRHRLILLCALLFFVLSALTPPAEGQARPGGERSRFKAGVGLGYLSRVLDLEEEVEGVSPEMTVLLAGLVLEYEFTPGFSLSAQIGYSSSAFDGLAFRRLPISLEIGADSGKMGGILLGAEVEKSFFDGAAFGLAFRGQILASLGLDKEWDIPGLAATGSAKGTPAWMNASAGPVLTYKGLKGLTPYVYPRFDYLWGDFKLEETVQELKGDEKKDIKGKSMFGLGLGADFELASVRLRAEAGLHPRPAGMDYSVLVRTLLAF
jgi:hypothetical protein